MADSRTTDFERWWVAVREESTGPYSTGFVVASLRSGLILPDQLVCAFGKSDWRPVKDWPQLQPYLPSTRAQSTTTSVEAAASVSAASATALGLLCSPERMVQSLAIYGIVVNPFLCFVSVITTCMSGTTFADGTDAQGAEALFLLGSLFASFVMAGIWLVCGIFLNQFDRRGLWLAIGACTFSWVGVGAAVLVFLMLLAVFPNAEHRIQQPLEGLVSIFGMLISAIDLGFQSVATILLILYRNAVPWKNFRNNQN